MNEPLLPNPEDGTISENASIQSWLDALRPGYAERFAACFLDVGVEQVGDLAFLGGDDMASLEGALAAAGCKGAMLNRVRAAIQQTQTTQTPKKPAPATTGTTASRPVVANQVVVNQPQPVVPNQVLVGVQAEGGQWSSDLFTCCSDCCTCFAVWCCACVVWGQLWERTFRQPGSCVKMATGMGVVYAILSVLAPLSTSGNSNGLVTACTSVLQTVMAIVCMVVVLALRRAIRKRDGIPETICCEGTEDCCCAFWCMPCVSCQMARHEGFDKGGYDLGAPTGVPLSDAMPLSEEQARARDWQLMGFAATICFVSTALAVAACAAPDWAVDLGENYDDHGGDIYENDDYALTIGLWDRTIVFDHGNPRSFYGAGDDYDYQPSAATYFNRFTTIVGILITFACCLLYVFMAVKGRSRATEQFCACALQIAGLFLLLGVTSWFIHRDDTFAVPYADMDENCNNGCAVAFVDGAFCLALGFVMGQLAIKKSAADGGDGSEENAILQA